MSTLQNVGQLSISIHCLNTKKHPLHFSEYSPPAGLSTNTGEASVLSFNTDTREALQMIPVMFIIKKEWQERQKQVYTVRTSNGLCIINVLLMRNGQGQKSQDRCWNMDVTLKEPTDVAASGPSGHTASQNIYVYSWKTT